MTRALARLGSDQVRAGSLAKDGLKAEGNENESRDCDTYLDRKRRRNPRAHLQTERMPCIISEGRQCPFNKDTGPRED